MTASCLLRFLCNAASACREEAAPASGLGRGVSFRGDSRWVGLAKAAGQDVLAGMTQSRQLYVAEFACS